MGRLQKKKDPEKKKAQRVAKAPDASESLNTTSGNGTAPKAAPVLKKPTVAAKTKAGTQEPNIFQKSIQFLREVKIELKKVTWPSRKQTMGSTVVVIVLVMIISLFLGLVDFSLSSLMQVVLP